MQNGYALPSFEGLEEVYDRLSSMSEAQLDELRSLLRVGVHSNVQVTIDDCKHSVTQVSALHCPSRTAIIRLSCGNHSPS